MRHISPFNPPTHNLVTTEQPMRSFKVRTVSTDFVGRLIADERIVQAPTAKSIKRSIYLSIKNVHSISIVEVTDKK
jgi:hypothetical protein